MKRTFKYNSSTIAYSIAIFSAIMLIVLSVMFSPKVVNATQKKTKLPPKFHELFFKDAQLDALASIDTVIAGEPNRPRLDMIDISSWNGDISVSAYKKMKAFGVKSVVVKITEARTYENPFAKAQIKNAKAAGLVVLGYHFAWHNTAAKADEEASYFAKTALKVGLTKNTVMVDDVEAATLRSTNASKYTDMFLKKLKSLGFKYTSIYASESWFNNGFVSPNSCEVEKCWVASYPYHPKDTQNWVSWSSAWQWNSKLWFPNFEQAHSLDISQVYNDYLITDHTPKTVVPYFDAATIKPVTLKKSKIVAKVNKRKAVVTWSPSAKNKEFSGYEVYWRASGDKKWKLVKMKPSQIQKTFLNLKPKKIYYFKVRSYIKIKDGKQYKYRYSQMSNTFKTKRIVK